jgi:hypothetical protein
VAEYYRDPMLGMLAPIRPFKSPRRRADVSFIDAANGGSLDHETATEMARLLRTAADIVDALPTCDDVERRLVLWRQLAELMVEFDSLLPEQPEP